MDVPPVNDLADHLHTIARRWWLVVGLVALGLLLTAGVTAWLPRTYASTASVLVLPSDSQDANAVGGRTKSVINLDTEAQLVTSNAVAARAVGLLHSTTAPAVLSRSVSVSVPPNSTVLKITFTAGTPAAARAGSHAFATAYLANRDTAAVSANNQTAKQLDAQIKTITGKLRSTTDASAREAAGSSKRAFLDTQRRNLSNQLDTLTGKRTAIATAGTTTGRVISDASLPTAPASPATLVNLGSGALVGLLVGLVAALLHARFGRRIRHADDLPRHTGVPLLAELPSGGATLFGRDTSVGRTFARLRNELAARRDLAQPGGQPPADRDSGAPSVIVVAGTLGELSATLVATNLAAAFGRSGAETILIDAAGTAPTRRGNAADLTGVPTAPGWANALADQPAPGRDDADALADRATQPGGAIHPAAHEPHLRVMPAGAPGTAGGGPVPSETARFLLDGLRGQAAHIILAAPGTSDGADAQTLAALADAAILVVERGATTRVRILDAAEQLRRVGAPLLGAVLLPPSTPVAAAPEPTLAAPGTGLPDTGTARPQVATPDVRTPDGEDRPPTTGRKPSPVGPGVGGSRS